MAIQLLSLYYKIMDLRTGFKKVKIMPILALVPGLFVLVGCEQWHGRIAANKGHSAYLEKNFDEAIASYEEALTQLPKDKTLLRNLAYSYFAASRMEIPREEAKKKASRAIELLEQLLNEEPDSTELASLLLDAWEQNDRLNDAVKFFKARIEKNPNDLQSIKGLGVVELKRGNFRDAIALYKRRIEIEPNETQIHLLIAQTSWQWLRAGGPNDLQEAIALATSAFEAAMQAAKRDPEKVEPLVFGRLLLFQRVQLNKDNPKEIEKDRLEIEAINKKIDEINKKAEALSKKEEAQKAGPR